MGWGALMGLGEGLQQAGKMWQERDKQKLAEQLEIEREKRAETRQLAKEERDAKRLENTVVVTRPEQDDDGVWWMRGYNAAGTPKGEPRLATQGEIKSASMQRDKDKVSLDKLVTDAALAEYKAGRAPLEAKQSDQLFEQQLRAGEANIDATNARAASYGRKPLDEEEESDEFAYVDQLASEAEDLLTDYNVPASERDSFLRGVIRDAAKYKIHPRSLLNDALLEKYGMSKNKPKNKKSKADPSA